MRVQLLESDEYPWDRLRMIGDFVCDWSGFADRGWHLEGWVAVADNGRRAQAPFEDSSIPAVQASSSPHSLPPTPELTGVIASCLKAGSVLFHSTWFF